MLDAVTGELLGREVPLTREEKLSAFERIRTQALTVDLAARRRDAAKEEAKEAKAVYEREIQRLFDMSRHDPQGILFPVTDEEIKEASQVVAEPPPPKEKPAKGDTPTAQPLDGDDSAKGDTDENDEASGGERAA